MYNIDNNNNNKVMLLKYHKNLLLKKFNLLTDPKRLEINNVSSIHIQQRINAIKTKKIAIIQYLTIYNLI